MAYEKCCFDGKIPAVSEVNYCPGFVNWHSQRLSANGILARFQRIASPVDKVVDPAGLESVGRAAVPALPVVDQSSIGARARTPESMARKAARPNIKTDRR